MVSKARPSWAIFVVCCLALQLSVTRGSRIKIKKRPSGVDNVSGGLIPGGGRPAILPNRWGEEGNRDGGVKGEVIGFAGGLESNLPRRAVDGASDPEGQILSVPSDKPAVNSARLVMNPLFGPKRPPPHVGLRKRLWRRPLGFKGGHRLGERYEVSKKQKKKHKSAPHHGSPEKDIEQSSKYQKIQPPSKLILPEIHQPEAAFDGNVNNYQVLTEAVGHQKNQPGDPPKEGSQPASPIPSMAEGADTNNYQNPSPAFQTMSAGWSGLDQAGYQLDPIHQNIAMDPAADAELALVVEQMLSEILVNRPDIQQLDPKFTDVHIMDAMNNKPNEMEAVYQATEFPSGAFRRRRQA